MIKSWFKNIGPGPLIAAAFIGPGTVTLCSIAGVQFGYALLWAMVISVLATVVLQEMAARLGLITQQGLADVLRQAIRLKAARVAAFLLIISAIVIGNAAYEAGNISGGILGLEAVLGTVRWNVAGLEVNLYSGIIGVAAFLILYFGSYKHIERWLLALVVLLSVSFLVTAFLTSPDWSAVLAGFIQPELNSDNLLTVVGLIGTTVVPYNLFLHASLVKEKWKSAEAIPHARRDTFIAVILGGIVSMSIIIAAAGVGGNAIVNAADLARALEPLYGESAKVLLAIGLFAAGITSAITAPLAAAYVCAGCFGWSDDLKSGAFRAVWMIVLAAGVMAASINLRPIDIIKFAQIANGILLPVIAAYLIWVVNRKALMGSFRNNWWQNVIALCILVFTVLLGVRSVLKVLNVWV